MANYTSVVASNICDAAGNKLASGTVSFQATDAGNQPINFQVGGGGQVVTTPATAAITAGTIAGGFQVADSANTSPAGILYRITITDTTLNRVVVTYSLVTVTGTTFTLDNYVPTGASVLPPTGGSVNGPLTVTGNLSVTGSFNPGTLGNVTSTGTILAKNIEGVRYADQFPGSDMGAQINAAVADLGARGGEIYIPAGTYNNIATTIVLSVPVILRGAGAGIASGVQPTILNFTAGTTGLQVGPASQFSRIADIYFKSGSTVAGNDDGILVQGHGVYIEDVVVEGFGRKGINFTASTSNGQNANNWTLVNVRAFSGKGDGFFWTGTDVNVGTAITCDASHNAGWGFNIAVGAVHTFISPHADANGLGAYRIDSGSSNVFFNVYAENSAISSFVLTANANNNRVWFSTYAQPTTITDSGQSNQIWYNQGTVPCVNGLNIGPTPGASSPVVYGINSGTFGGGWGSIVDQTNGVTFIALNRLSSYPTSIQTATSVAGNLNCGGLLVNAGSVVSGIQAYAQTLTPASVAAATAAEQTFTVTGLTTADKVIVNPAPTGNSTMVGAARVSATNTLAIQFVNPTAGALTPGSGVYTILALRA